MSFTIENGVLKKYTEEDVTEVTIPDGVTSIGNSAFMWCENLTSITIPDGVTSIGDEAFSGCTSLTSITIPDSVTSIGEYAFSGCESLTSITIPDNITSIGVGAFSYCLKLENITIPDNVTIIDDAAFYECINLESITISDSVKSIGKNIFPPNTEIILCKGDVKVPFILKYFLEEYWLYRFITTDINSRKQYFDEMETYYKIPLALFMTFAYPQKTYYLDYLKNNAEDAGKYLIDEEYIDLLYKFLELGFVTKKNIDSLISYAVEHTQNGGSSEPQLILSKYKSDNFSSKGADALNKLML